MNIERHIEKAQQGDVTSMGFLYASYHKAMLNTCMRIVKDLHKAEDIMQDAFIKAFENIHKLKEVKTFGAWLKKIMINESLNNNPSPRGKI